MNSENKTWQTVKNGYLNQVEKALSSVEHPRKKEVLEDVRLHLEQRFGELQPDHQTWENFQAIITEMGPAGDYAELLEPGSERQRQKVLSRRILWVGLAAVVIIAGVVLLPKLISPKVGYIITFEAVEPFEHQTPKELLEAFNSEVKFRVKTHHFRTEVKANKLVGHICTDTKADKGAIITMLEDSKRVKLISVKAASSAELERHYVLEQVSLKDEEIEKSKAGGGRPRIVSTSPIPFANDVSPELKEIKVTFDQRMMNLSWSWVGGGDTFPQTTGESHYDKNKTTCVLPVKLEAGKFYWVGINSEQHVYFQTPKGVPALPYVILFATKDKDGNPTAIPENYLEEAKEINAKYERP